MSDRRVFLGEDRRRIVDEIVRHVDAVDAGTAGPTWIALEAPSGWGKTRIAQEVYATLAARAAAMTGAYWPPEITTAGPGDDASRQILIDRKIVSPALVERAARSLPAFFWWGITAHERNGSASVALAQDLRQFDGHLPYLMARCKQLKRTRDKGLSDLRAVGAIALDEVKAELTAAALELAGLGLPGVGFVWRIGAWTTGRIKDAAKERKLIAASSSIEIDHTGVVDDAYETIQSLARPGLPVVIAVEDVHLADATLLALLTRLMLCGRPVLILSTAWPAAFETVSGLKDAASAIAAADTRDARGPRLLRLSPGAGMPDGWSPAARLAPLGDESLAQIVRAHYPGATPATLDLLTAHIDNPLQLELACALPSLRRRVGPDGVLELSESDVRDLPPALDEMYQQMWVQLPSRAREAIALTLCGIPALMAGAASDERWDTAMLMDVARNVFPDAVDLVSAVDSAATSYAWAQHVEHTLYSFIDEANLRVAASRRSEYFSDADVDRIRRELLHAVAAGLTDPDLPDSVRQHRAGLILALAAEGFGVEHDDLTVATQVQVELLSVHDDEAEHVVELIDRLVPDDEPAVEEVAPLQAPPRQRQRFAAPAAPLSMPIQRQRALALARAERFDDAEAAWVALIDEATDPRMLLEARVELASVRLRRPVRIRDEETGLLGLEAEVRSALGTKDPLWIRVVRLDAEEDFRSMDWRPRILNDLWRDDLSQTIADFGATDADVIALHRVNALHAHTLGYTGAAVELLGRLARALEQRVGEDHPEVLRLHAELGLYLYEQGFYADAEAELAATLARQDDTLGPEHVDSCRTLGHLARTEVRQGEFVSAFDRVEERLAVVRAMRGDGREQIFRLMLIRDELAILASAQSGHGGLLPQAVASLQDALPLVEERDGASSAEARLILTLIAWGLGLQDDHAAALSYAERSAWLGGYAREARDTWRAMIELGLCHERLDRPAEAATVYAELALMLEETATTLDLDKADIDFVAGPLAFAEGRIRELARTHSANPYPRAYFDASAPDTEPSYFSIDDILATPDDDDLRTLRRHHHGRSLVFGPAEHGVREMQYALAAFRLNRGQADQALAYAGGVLSIGDLPAYAQSRYEREISALERLALLGVVEDALANLGRPMEALEYFDRAVVQVTTPADQVEVLLRRIEFLSTHERFDDALADIDRAEGLMPTPEQSRALERRRRAALVSLGRRSDALVLLDRAVEAASDDDELKAALSDRSAAYTEAGAHEHAVIDLESILAVQPDDPWTHSRLALALTELDRHDESGEHFRAAVRNARETGATFTDLFVRAAVVEMVLQIGYSDDALALIDDTVLLIETADEIGSLRPMALRMFDPLRVRALELEKQEQAGEEPEAD